MMDCAVEAIRNQGFAQYALVYQEVEEVTGIDALIAYSLLFAQEAVGHR